MFLLGDSPELGEDDLANAIKLEPSKYPMWQIDLSLPVGSSFRYRFYVRSDKAEDIGKSENGRAISESQSREAGFTSLPKLKVEKPSPGEPSEGEYRRDYAADAVPKLRSKILGEERAYRVVLPPSYDRELKRRYPVLYTHDGQNVFEEGPYGSWNGIDALNNETNAGRMREVIVVGIDNSAKRSKEYVPNEDKGTAQSYVQFIRDELKPFIDKKYRTLRDPAHTAVLGSSLGGLVSMHMLWDFSATFGRAGVFSGSFMFPNFRERLKTGRRPVGVRLYLDSGTAGSSFDGFYNSRLVRDSLISRGKESFIQGKDFHYVVGAGHAHNEAAWAERLPAALSFLFPACEE